MGAIFYILLLILLFNLLLGCTLYCIFNSWSIVCRLSVGPCIPAINFWHPLYTSMCKKWVNIFQFCSVTQVKCIVHKPFEIKYEIDHDEHAERDFFLRISLEWWLLRLTVKLCAQVVLRNIQTLRTVVSRLFLLAKAGKFKTDEFVQVSNKSFLLDPYWGILALSCFFTYNHDLEPILHRTAPVSNKFFFHYTLTTDEVAFRHLNQLFHDRMCKNSNRINHKAKKNGLGFWHFQNDTSSFRKIFLRLTFSWLKFKVCQFLSVTARFFCRFTANS